MWGAILSWFAGGGLNALTGSLEKAYEAKLAAQTDEQRLDAEKQIAFFQGQIQLATTAAQNDKWYYPRELMGWCATGVVFKLMIWDTVFQLGSTPNPGPLVMGLLTTIVGFFFGSKAVTDLGGKLLAGLLSKR